MNYKKMFSNMHPGFFDDPGIKGMPKDWAFSELIMDLRKDMPSEVLPHCPEKITFGEYKGDIDKLKKAVYEVDEDWVQYFGEWSRVFCAFDRDEVVAFCILSNLGMQDGLKVGGPGCVGTIPKYRKQGIGLEMVRRATEILKKEKYDISWIHYTHIENWYKKLGYEIVLRWNSDGIDPEGGHILRLEKVNGKNVWDILKLHVSEDQKSFVAENEISIIEAYTAITGNGYAFPFGIYDGNTPIGFLMIGFDTDDYWDDAPVIANGNYNLWRLMIDTAYQGRGYGKEAMKLALDFIRTYPCGKAEYCWLSYEPENQAAAKLYKSFGFEETGDRDGEELIAVLKL